MRLNFKNYKLYDHTHIYILTTPTARGLDIASIRTVVNYDMARDIDTHVHRIGRTGRAGTKGTAYTLVLPKDVNMAGDLVRNLVSLGIYIYCCSLL